MDYHIMPSRFSGSVRIPGSKSHTIRALICALHAEGESIIRNPLVSADTLAGRKMAENLGATIIDEGDLWRVRGTKNISSRGLIDVGNSGTSLYFGIAAAALSCNPIEFDGDSQIRNRSAKPLLDALEKLGVTTKSNRGCAPLTVCGPIKPGKTSVQANTSQHLSSLLLAAPLVDGIIEIDVPLLNEKPYVEMTLQWLDRCGIKYENDNFKHFKICGPQRMKSFDISIPADFSSASFFLAAGAICGGSLTLDGLDYGDVQGDKRVVDILREMGAKVEINGTRITVQGPLTHGGEFDLNEIPDALPILSAVACFVPGKTRLYNVEHARIKETDRISAMREELESLGGIVEEQKDGLTISYSPLIGGTVSGRGDHRIIMSCAIAGCASQNGIVINGADAVDVTFPEFASLVRLAGGKIEEV